MIVASYSRYSTDMQRPVSIDDQERKANKLALDVLGIPVSLHYRDHAESGWNPKRSDYERLLRDARAKLFQVLALDDLSRLGRDQDERGLTIRRLEFIGVRLLTASGYDSTLPVQLRTMMRSASGMVDSMYSIDLAQKTHRGLTGQALKGFNTGGRSYGYRHLPILDTARLDEYGRARVIAARREIDETQAAVVREIFELFLAGRSARAIAHALNKKGIKAPRGGVWRLSAIYGDRRTGVGILNNPLYAGEVIWNRSRWEREPDSGKRRRFERPPAEWIRRQDEALRIVAPPVWEAAQRRLARRTHKPGRKARHLFSGLLRCGVCAGAYVKVDRYRYGCATHKDAGPAACANGLKMAVDRADRALVAGIQRELLNAEAIELFRSETAALLRADKRDDTTRAAKARLGTLDREIRHLVDAIKGGALSAALRAELAKLEAERQALQTTIESANALAELPDFLPRVTGIFQEMVDGFEDMWRADSDRGREHIRAILGEEIQLVPKPQERLLEARIDPGTAICHVVRLAVGAGLDNVVAGACGGHKRTILSIPASGVFYGVKYEG